MTDNMKIGYDVIKKEVERLESLKLDDPKDYEFERRYFISYVKGVIKAVESQKDD